MDRARLLFLTTFLCAFLALIFVIVALSTKEWMVINISGIGKLSAGLWDFCILNKCYPDVATAPAVLTIVTAVLILISLVVTSLINARKRSSPNIFFIPVIFFFVSIIILLATIAILWQKLSQHSIAKVAANDIIGESKLNSRILNAGKIDGSSSQIYNSPASSLDELGLNGVNLNNFIAFKHGFSSALLISAFPLLLICLVASTFVAAFHKAESTATQNHADKH